MESLKTVVMCSFTVKDKDGKVTSHKEWESESLVRAWQRILYNTMNEVSANVADTSNTNRSIGAGAGPILRAKALAADVTYGPVIGRSNQAVAMADYALITPITEGVGANQMNFALTAVTHVEAVGGDYVQLQRVATNNSGNPITVEEMALYVKESPDLWYFCIARDLTGSTVVAAGSTGTMTYRIINNL